MTIVETVAAACGGPTSPAVRRLGAAALCACSLAIAQSALAAYDVTIVASGSSSGGAWSGDTWTATAKGATLPASEIESHLTHGPTSVNTGSKGRERGDITVNGAITWSANTLTLSAARDVDIEAALTGTGSAALSLAYGQGTAAAGNQGIYRIGVPVTLSSATPTSAANFTTLRGYDGTPAPRAVPLCPKLTRLGWIWPGCSYLSTTGPFTITYKTVEVNAAPDAGTFVFLDPQVLAPGATGTYYPYAQGVQTASNGQFLFPMSINQVSDFGPGGTIYNLAGLTTDTTIHETSVTWDWGPMHTFFDSSIFANGYYIQFQPNAGEMGRGYQTLSLLVTDQVSGNTSYSVVDYVFHVLPSAPTVSAAGNLSLANSTPGNVDLTLAGTGPLSLSMKSSNTAVLHNASITGTGVCTGAGTCSLTVTPLPDAGGDATVTVTVTDAYYQTATTTFTVSVSAPPTGGGGALAFEGVGLLLLCIRRRRR